MAYAAREPGKPGYVAICLADPKYAKDIAEFITEQVADGNAIEYVTREIAVAGFREYADAK